MRSCKDTCKLHPTELTVSFSTTGHATKRENQSSANTHKQTQGGYEIEETKKYGSNERTEQKTRKRTK